MYNNRNNNKPKQKYLSDQRFINPYNFVGMGDVVVRTSPEVHGGLTGKISCKLITKTPLAIIDAESMTLADKNNHKNANFFHINNKPVIPGSEIRGMLRSVYETLTDSCMSVMNIDTLSKRYSDANLPGLIRYNNEEDAWELFCAERYGLNTQKYRINKTGKWKVQIGDKQYSTGDVITNPEVLPRDVDKGYVLLWAEIYNKRKDSIFILKKQKIMVNQVHLKKAVENFEILQKIYVDHDEKFEKIIYKLKTNGEFTPVWYQEFNGIIYLSPSAIGRRVFSKDFQDIIGGKVTENESSHAKCVDNKNLCPACALFGMVKEKDKDGTPVSCYGSKVRITDANALEYCYYQNGALQHLQELSSPKTSCVEFYTFRPDDKPNWGYDDNVEIRGRKFYFHHNNYGIKNTEQPRAVSTQLMDIGSSFAFDVYFDNISEESLQKLVWAITIGDNNEDSRLCHKLGYGKPLGLGSVKVVVDNILLRDFIEDSYLIEAKQAEDYLKQNLFDEDILKEFRVIANMDTAACVVRYPYVKEGDEPKNANNNKYANHQWYAKNKMQPNDTNDKGEATGTNPIIHFTIPAISEQDLSLPAMQDNGTADKNTYIAYGKNPRKRQIEVKVKMCSKCHRQFAFTVEEQKEFIDKYGKDYIEPTKCKYCRKK